MPDRDSWEPPVRMEEEAKDGTLTDFELIKATRLIENTWRRMDGLAGGLA
jgi:hypothetical protein